MCVLAGSLRPRVSAAVCVPQAQEWHPVVHKKTLNASHAKKVSVHTTPKWYVWMIKSFRNSFTL